LIIFDNFLFVKYGTTSPSSELQISIFFLGISPIAINPNATSSINVRSIFTNFPFSESSINVVNPSNVHVSLVTNIIFVDATPQDAIADFVKLASMKPRKKKSKRSKWELNIMYQKR
jgi:hypothetical protein